MGNKIGRVTPSGVLTEFPISTPNRLPLGIAAAPDGNLYFAEQQDGQVVRLGLTPSGLNHIAPSTEVSPTMTPVASVVTASQLALLPSYRDFSALSLAGPQALLIACTAPDDNKVAVLTMTDAVNGFQAGFSAALLPANDEGIPVGTEPVGLVNLQITPGATPTAQATMVLLQGETLSSFSLNMGTQPLLTFPAPGTVAAGTIVQTRAENFSPPANANLRMFNWVVKRSELSVGTLSGRYIFNGGYRFLLDSKEVFVHAGGNADGKINTTVAPGATLTPGMIRIVPVTRLLGAADGTYAIQGLSPNSANSVTLLGGVDIRPNWYPNDRAGLSFRITNTAGSAATPPGSYSFAVVGKTGNMLSLTSFTATVGGPDFSLGFDQSTVTAQAGTKARLTININRTGGFTGNVTVTPPDPADGIKAKPPDPITTTDSSVAFKMKIAGGATPGPHQLIFKGKDDSGRERDVTLTLIIQ